MEKSLRVKNDPSVAQQVLTKIVVNFVPLVESCYESIDSFHVFFYFETFDAKPEVRMDPAIGKFSFRVFLAQLSRAPRRF